MQSSVLPSKPSHTPSLQLGPRWVQPKPFRGGSGTCFAPFGGTSAAPKPKPAAGDDQQVTQNKINHLHLSSFLTASPLPTRDVGAPKGFPKPEQRPLLLGHGKTLCQSASKTLGRSTKRATPPICRHDANSAQRRIPCSDISSSLALCAQGGSEVKVPWNTGKSCPSLPFCF